jgi:hypothetical protein
MGGSNKREQKKNPLHSVWMYTQRQTWGQDRLQLQHPCICRVFIATPLHPCTCITLKLEGGTITSRTILNACRGRLIPVERYVGVVPQVGD